MSVFAVSMVRNEQDVIGDVVLHLLGQGVDHVIVADNLSTDRTRAILDRLAQRHPVTVVDDPEPAYLQAQKMTRLADLAREMGATWVIPFDADELWVSADGRPLADLLRETDDADVLQGLWLERVPPLLPYRRRCWDKMTARQAEPDALRKVAFRALPGLVVSQGNHRIISPEGLGELRVVDGRMHVHHYRWRGPGHFMRKNRQGKAAVDAGGARLDKDWAWEWRQYGALSGYTLLKVYVRMVRDQRRAGVVTDRIRPSTPSSPA